ncbi:hypothetical protein KAR91_06965 [Candidatus Pacearchaeota archaeon]|nr:hypothetical protein [Candidatus Pacearchaeota archaeon]
MNLTKLIRKTIIDEIKNNPDVKTNILKKVKSIYFHGHVDGGYVDMIIMINNVFKKMVKDGEVIFTPRKPLKLGEGDTK